MAYKGGTLAPLYDPGLVPRALREMAHDGGEAYKSYAEDATPHNYNPFSSPEREPGTLAKRWVASRPHKDVARGQPALTVDVWNWDPIAGFVENDTRPHEIRPKLAGGVLVFRLWPWGTLVHAKVVKHPGTTGWHMTLKAANRVAIHFEALMEPALIRWSKRAVRAGRKAQP